MNTSEDPNWWVAKAKGGKEGMIPANYVELLPDGVGKLERSATLPRDANGKVGPMPWFHGKIARVSKTCPLPHPVEDTVKCPALSGILRFLKD